MAFSDVPRIEDYEFYIDVAFSRAKKIDEKEKDEKKKQLMKMRAVEETLVDCLLKILKKFPEIDKMDGFYNELFKAVLDYVDVKKSLGALFWAVKKINSLHRDYEKKVHCVKERSRMNLLRVEYYGRIKSVLKQIKDALKILENARRTLIEFPVIKTGMRTCCIAGFPNVGKTTLLFKLTGSKAEIKPYAFTTKGVNISYLGDLQLLDTPGTLNRDKQNKIELVAEIAMKHLAEFFIYVFDPTEEYPIEDQIKLYNKIKKYGKKVLVYASKTDICKENKFEKFNPLSFEELKKELETYSADTSL